MTLRTRLGNGQTRRMVAEALAANPCATVLDIQRLTGIGCRKLIGRYLLEVGTSESMPGGAHIGKRWTIKPDTAPGDPPRLPPDEPRGPSPHRWLWQTDGMGRVLGLNPLPPAA